MQDVQGVCEVCGREVASFTCKLCGARVGARCFDAVNGVCIRCARGRIA